MTLERAQFWITAAVLALAPLLFGSVDLFWVVLWTGVLSTSALACAFIQMGTKQIVVLIWFLTLCATYALVAVVQFIPNLSMAFSDSSWIGLNRLLGLDTLPRISIRAEIPPLAAGHFMLLLTSVISGFSIGVSHVSCEKFLGFARYVFLGYVVYGTFADFVTPNMILWAPKVAYLGSLTATFVNRNTAATFIGAGTILWFCSALSSLRSIRFSSLKLLLLSASDETIAFRVIYRFAVVLTCFFALLLTGSRGGLICTSIGLIVALVLMASERASRFWISVLAGALSLAAASGLLSQMGRIGSQGLFDDGRWDVYQLCIEAIRKRPIFGSGLGTFGDLFPSLRSEDFNSGGVWEYAHSTFFEIAVEMGVPAAAVVVIGAVASIVLLSRAALLTSGRNRRSISALAGIAVLGALHSTIDFSLQIPGCLVAFAVLLGVGLARASAAHGGSPQHTPPPLATAYGR